MLYHYLPLNYFGHKKVFSSGTIPLEAALRGSTAQTIEMMLEPPDRSALEQIISWRKTKANGRNSSTAS